MKIILRQDVNELGLEGDVVGVAKGYARNYLIPKSIAIKIVNELERRLASTNFKHRSRIPTEIMEAYGEKKSEEGFDAVVFGHFHKKLEIPAGAGHVYVLPAWFEGGEALVIAPDTGEWRWEVV